MRPGNPEVSEQCATISGLLRYRERDIGTATARKAASVIGDHAIVVCNAGLGPQSEVGIGKNAAVDQQQRLPGALYFGTPGPHHSDLHVASMLSSLGTTFHTCFFVTWIERSSLRGVIVQRREFWVGSG